MNPVLIWFLACLAGFLWLFCVAVLVDIAWGTKLIVGKKR